MMVGVLNLDESFVAGRRVRVKVRLRLVITGIIEDSVVSVFVD